MLDFIYSALTLAGFITTVLYIAISFVTPAKVSTVLGIKIQIVLSSIFFSW